MYAVGIRKCLKWSKNENIRTWMRLELFLIKNHHFSLMKAQFGPAFSSDNSGDGPSTKNGDISDGKV